jgi:hypothetical protein
VLVVRNAVVILGLTSLREPVAPLLQAWNVEADRMEKAVCGGSILTPIDRYASDQPALYNS